MSDQYITDKNGGKIDPSRGVQMGPRGGMSQRTSEKNSSKKQPLIINPIIAAFEGDGVSLCIDKVNGRFRIRHKGNRSKDVVAYINKVCGRPIEIYDHLNDIAKEFELIRVS